MFRPHENQAQIMGWHEWDSNFMISMVLKRGSVYNFAYSSCMMSSMITMTHTPRSKVIYINSI